MNKKKIKKESEFKEWFMKNLLKNTEKLSLFFIILFSLILMQGVLADTIFSDGLESGDLNDWNLTHTGTANDWTVETTNPYFGTYHADSNPGDVGEWSTMEINISTFGYENINFTYYRRLIGLDAADDFRVQWYDGSSWITVEQLGSSSANDADYSIRSFILPSTANDNLDLIIKFDCEAGAVSESCRVDNISLSGDIIIGDTTPPEINSVFQSPESVILNTPIKITANITDDVEVDSALIEINEVNYSMNQQSAAAGSFEDLFFDDFETGTLNSNNWDTYGTIYWGVNLMDPLENGYHAQAPKTGVSDPSYLQINISTNNYRNLTVSYYKKLISIDAADDFAVEWFDGTSWNILEQVGAGIEDDSDYVYQTYNLSATAEYNPNFSLRFMCECGAVSEYCRIDNVSISGILNESSTEIWEYEFSPDNLSNYNYTIYANDTSGNNATSASHNFSVVESNVTISETIIDISNNTLNVTIEIEDVNNITVYNQTSISHLIGLPKGRYKIRIKPISHPIKQIKFDELNITHDISSLVDIDDPANNLNYNELLAFNPIIKNSTENDTITVTITAADIPKNKILYKCGNWDFENQNCSGNWTAWMAISPGQEYNATFDFADPGLAEGNGTFFEGFESGSLDTNNWTISGASVWEIDNKKADRFAGLKYVYSKSTGGIEDILEINISTENYTNVTFNFYYKTKDMVAGDYIAADWYNGSDWIEVLNTQGTTVWTLDSNILGSEADNNPDFKIRFRCLNDAGGEACYVDNVEVNGDWVTVDLSPPTFSNYSENPINGSVYTGYSEFNVTVNDTNLDYVGIEFNSVNYSVDNILDVYSFNSSLAAGTYTYYWWANDTQNYNTSEIRYYTISKSSQTASLNINASSPITYGEYINVTCNGELFRDSVDVSSEIGESILLGVGTYEYSCQLAENQNYTYDDDNQTFVVNKATSLVYLYLNNSRDNITILENNSLEINASLQTGEGNILIYNEGSLIYSGVSPSYNVSSFSSGIYNITAIYFETQNYSGSSETFYVNSTTLPDVTDPVVEVLFPENSEYNYSNLELNFSAEDVNLDTCWKSLNQGGNVTISCYENNTINSTEVIEGLNLITVYANDTSGNLGFDETIFTYSPTGEDFNYTLIVYPLEYIFNAREFADEINEFEISLYDNSNLTILVNISYEMQVNNFSFLTSPLSVYLNESDSPEDPIRVNVSIQANLGVENGTYNGTITFNVSLTGANETVELVYGINPPSGIPKIYSLVGEECINEFSPLSCSDAFIVNPDSTYTINYKAVNNGTYPLLECYIRSSLNWTVLSLVNFSLNASEDKDFSVTYSPTTSQEVGVYYDQIYLDCMKGDSLGNRVTSPPGNRPMNKVMLEEANNPPPNNGGSSGSSSNFGILGRKTIKDLQIGKLSDLIVNLGESKKMTVSVKNNGSSFLNECKLKGRGNTSWVSSQGVKGLGAGEEHEFILDLKVPLGLDKGVYSIEFDIICKEFNKSSKFNAEILENKLAVDIINVEREKNSLKIDYSLAEFSGFNQEVEVEIILFDGEEKVAEGKEIRMLEAEIKKSFEISLDIDSGLKGSFNLLITAKSNSFSTFTQEEVVLGGSLGGWAILDDAQRNKYISIALLFLLLGFAIFIAIKMINHKRFKKRIGLKKVGKVEKIKRFKRRKRH